MIQRPIKRLIKESVEKLLKNGNTSAKENIFLSRSIPSEDITFPIVNIYSLSESIERFNEAPKNYRRRMTLLIECLSKGDDDNSLDNSLEILANQIEFLMEKDETLGGLLNKLELSSADYQQEPDGATPLGLLSLRYTLEFFTEPDSGADTYESFIGTDTGWKIKHGDKRPDEFITAHDKTNLDQGD